MHIQIVTPAARGSRMGNRITAARWARILKQLGHQVQIGTRYEGQAADVLIGLHARKSASSIRSFCERYPERPCVVALTGTDLYGDLQRSTTAQDSLKLASRLVLLQPAGVEEIPVALRGRCRVIFQSAIGIRKVPPLRRSFEVVVAGHLRPVKDPFRTAYAVRQLPASSSIKVTHVGAALSDRMREMAEAEMDRNTRYRWVGEQTHGRTRRLIARARLLVLSSRMEGGASVIAEALVNGTPVIASDISGNRGMLGDRFPALFPLADTRALRELLVRFEADREFAREIRRWCRDLAPQHAPRNEVRCWKELLAEIS